MLEEQIIYQSILQQLEDDVKKDYQQLSDICKRQHKQIVIFGAGTYGKYLLEQIKQYGLVQYLLGFSDNDKNKLGGGVGKCANIFFRLLYSIKGKFNFFDWVSE